MQNVSVEWEKCPPFSIIELATADQLAHSKISRPAQLAVKRKNPTPSVRNRVEHFFGILTSEFRVFYLYIYILNLFIFHAFRVLVILSSGF